MSKYGLIFFIPKKSYNEPISPNHSSHMKEYKIVAITQVHNELRKGNLERFFTYITPNVDAVVVYDDVSTDGSYEYAKTKTEYTIRGKKNNFTAEWEIKQKLVEKALTLNPDFILLIDADEVVTDTDGKKLQKLAGWVIEKDLDGAYVHDINLWRSRSWKRVDSDFDLAIFPRFWRVGKEKLTYTNRKAGLHQSPTPDQIQKLERQDIVSFLHFGFADEKNIVAKYLQYSSRGQRGENLARFINEIGLLRTEKVDRQLYPNGLWLDDEAPAPLNGTEWYTLINKYRDEVHRPSISIVCLIYQSTAWLQFVYDQVLKHTDLSDKEFFFVANDATPEVKSYLRDNYIPHYIFDNTEEHRKEWYINNVYRAYNHGAEKAKGDFILFINSDMAFAPNWVENLLAHYDGKSCIASRLVESGNLPTGGLCIEKNFGRHLVEYEESNFIDYTKTIALNETRNDGAFMPLLIKKEDFFSVGGYPEGNVRPGGDFFHPTIVQKGEPFISGDMAFMGKLATKGITHKTAFDSISYHFQEGEKRDELAYIEEGKGTQVIIMNNSLHGKMKEKVLWDFLLERLPAVSGIDYEKVGADELSFERKAALYIEEHYPNAKIVIQNASFMDIPRPDLHTIAFLQDDLRRMNRISPKQEEVLALATEHVSNSNYTAASYLEYYFDIIPIGVDTELFKPGDKEEMRKKHGLPIDKKIGIFVGDLSEVKGWSEVKALIEKYTDIHWIVVTKGSEKFERPNVSLYKQINQAILAELHSSSDFFIIGSRVETLCLAAMEASCCDIPVIMRKIGVFADFPQDDLDKCGIFGDDFEKALLALDQKKFSPREVMIRRGLTIETTIELWWQKIAQAKLKGKARVPYTPPTYTFLSSVRRYFKMIFNKTFVIIVARRYLSVRAYESLLQLWRVVKKFKKSLLS